MKDSLFTEDFSFCIIELLKWEKVGVLMLFGSYDHQLDNKNRLVIPSKFLPELSDKLYILKGFDGCLAIYPEESFKTLVSKLEAKDFNLSKERENIRLALSSVFCLEIDKVNRVVIPTTLAKKYHISQSVKVVGVIDHLEVWSIDRWEEYSSKAEEHYEDNAEKSQHE